MAQMSVEQVQVEEKRLNSLVRGAKLVSEQERHQKALWALAEQHAEVAVSGLDECSGPLRALRAHLRSIKVEIARLTVKLSKGAPAQTRISELQSEAETIIRSIRRRENEMLSAVEEVQG
jgi:hypothetical protein